jgi:3-methyladenine DNA glycosylase/8-oxoguanine DNA glycosylase
MPEAQVSTATVDAPGVDPSLVLGPLAMLHADPTVRIGSCEAVRATWTPEGQGCIALTWGREPGRISVQCHGAGGAWLQARAARLVGAHDEISSFRPEDGVVKRLWARFAGDRVGATGTVWHDLAWIAVQQRVRRADAAGQWRRLVMALGESCADHDGLYTPPPPERLARAAPWSLRAMGIDARRATTLIEAARVAHRLDRLAEVPFAEADRPLRSIAGVGPWTTGCLSGLTWGEPDTVITGDSGIPSLIAETLAGERRADDARMIELLEPFRPHRYRVLRFALAARTSRDRV